MEEQRTDRYAIPTAWIYEYLDSLPESSEDRNAITRMFVKWRKDEERKAG